MLGLFTAFAGLVYSFSADAADGHLRAPADGQTFPQVIGGVDWGYTNPTAALVFGLDGDARAWQLDEFYQRRAPLAGVVLPALVALTRKHGVETWYCGPDEPEHLQALQAALLDAGLPCRAMAANDAVRAGIQTVTGLLARREDGTRGLYVAPACVRTIAEYGSYQYPPEQAAAGLVSAWQLGAGVGTSGAGALGAAVSELPLKQNDHALDATRYALHTSFSQTRAAEAYLAGLQRRIALRQESRP